MIYYYDDSIFNIESFKERKDIKSILVTNKTPNPISKNMPPYYYVSMFHSKYPNNNYAKCMLDVPPIKPTKKIHIGNTICSRCTITTGSGLTIDEIKKITKKKAKTIIFDWDLTLSVCNGIYMPRMLNAKMVHSGDFVFPKKMDYTFEEIAQFYAGTHERFEAIKAMFKQLREKKINIFILTDNIWGNNPNEFAKILKTLDPVIEPHEIIYGNNNKIKVINNHSFFKRKKRPRTHSVSWLNKFTRKLFK